GPPLSVGAGVAKVTASPVADVAPRTRSGGSAITGGSVSRTVMVNVAVTVASTKRSDGAAPAPSDAVHVTVAVPSAKNCPAVRSQVPVTGGVPPDAAAGANSTTAPASPGSLPVTTSSGTSIASGASTSGSYVTVLSVLVEAVLGLSAASTAPPAGSDTMTVPGPVIPLTTTA